MSWALEAYDGINERIESCFPECLAIRETLCTVITPARTRLKDPLLGVMEKLLMLLVLGIFCWRIVASQTYELADQPTGFPLVYWQRRDFNGDRNAR